MFLDTLLIILGAVTTAILAFVSYNSTKKLFRKLFWLSLFITIGILIYSGIHGIIQSTKINELNEQADFLKTNLNTSKEEISELRKKIKYVNPYTQPIQSGKATVLIKIKTKEKFNSNYMDRGGYIAFRKVKDEILLLSNNQCVGKSINNEKVIFQGVFDLSASHKKYR